MRLTKHQILQWFMALSLLVVLTGCDTFGVPKPDTVKQKVAVGIVAVTEIRNTAATLLVAQKITKADAENIQKQADVMREGLVVVRGLADTDVSTAAGRLAAIQASLRALQAYLLERSK